MIVFAAWLAMFVIGGVSIASFSVFLPVLMNAFSWTRGMLSLGYTLYPV